MISCFHPLSESYVVAGSVHSELSIVKFPAAATVAAMGPRAVAPLSSAALGKCSHYAVDAIASHGEHVAVASSTTLSVWDAVRGCRARHWAVPDHATTTNYVSGHLLVAAGHGSSLHFYDVRSHHARPLWSAKIATDNLYTSAVWGDTVYAAGADGRVYGVDLRAQRQAVWALNAAVAAAGGARPQSNAVLSVRVAGGRPVALLESGDVVGVGSGPQFDFAAKASPAALRHRVAIDVSGSPDVCVVAGGEHGALWKARFPPGKPPVVSHTATGFSGLVPCVRWAPSGVYFCAGDQVYMMPSGD